MRRRFGAWIDAAVLPVKLFQPHRSAVIFMFHSISGNAPSMIRSEPAPSHSPQLFEDFVTWLSARARTVTIEGLLQEIGDGTARFSQPTAALTFDDGYRDNYTTAWPILRRHGCTATVFVTTGFIDSPCALSEDMIREMHSDGIGFGSHTVSHPHLTRLPPQQALRELRASRERMEEILGRKCAAIAYPFGDHDRRIHALAREAGYKSGLSAAVIHGLNDLFSLPRVQLSHRNSGLSFAIRLYGAQSWRKCLHPAARDAIAE